MVAEDHANISEITANRVYQKLFRPTVRFSVLKQPVLALAASLVLVFGGLLSYHIIANGFDDASSSWHFVGFDTGNSRHVPVNAKPGKMIWQQQLHTSGGYAKPLAWENIVIISILGTQGTPSCIKGYDAATGNPVWQTPLEYGTINRDKTFSDRLIRKGRFYISNGIFCNVLDAATGNTIGKILPPPDIQGWTYLSADNDGLIGSSADGKTLFKINQATGKVSWTISLRGAIGQPAIYAKKLFCHTDMDELLAIDTRNGKTSWTYQLKTGNVLSKLYINDHLGVLVTENDEAMAFNTRTGKTAWNKTIAGIRNSGLALGNDTLYINGGLSALSLKTGNSFKRNVKGTFGYCSPPVLTNQQVVESFSLNTLFSACEGVVLAGKHFFTVSQNQLIAFSVSGID